jgi:hypothetical protein
LAVTFALRGNSLTAYYAPAGGFGGVLGTASITSSTASGVIGGSYIDLDQGAFGIHGLVYPGGSNLPAGQQFSLLMRVAVQSTADANQLFWKGLPGSSIVDQARFSGTSIIPFTTIDNAGNTLGTLNYTAAWAVNQYYDLVFTGDLSLTTNNQILWKDGTSVQTASSGSTRAAYPSPGAAFLMFGSQNLAAQNSCRIRLVESVIWNTIINPASVPLADGTTASLNGSARTSFVQATQLNGTAGGNAFIPSLGLRQFFMRREPWV